MNQWNAPGPAAGTIGMKAEPSRDLVRLVTAYKPELAHACQRYLSQALCEDTAEGLILSVPTTFHANGLQPHLTALEAALGQRIHGLQIRREHRPAESPPPRPALVQIPLSLPTRRPDAGKTALEIEKERRLPPPELICSAAFAQPVELLKRWSFGVNSGARSQCLWIHGASGSGKTYLARQLNRHISLEKRIVSIDVISFFHEWRRSIETKDQLSFHRKYRRETDVFVLENIDELANKPGTQQELLFTVGALLDRGAHVVVTSAKDPLSLQPLIEASLFSRLHSGLAIDMPTPDRAFKEAMWRALLTQHGLADYALDLVLVQRIFAIPTDTARKTHSLFINVISRLSFKQGLDMADLSELEARHGTHSPASSPGFQNPIDYLDRVAKICGLGTAAIMGRVKRPDVTLARRFVCLALSRHLGLTNATIASLIEKDPSTISHALKTIEDDLKTTRRIAQQWNYICEQLGMPADA